MAALAGQTSVRSHLIPRSWALAPSYLQHHANEPRRSYSSTALRSQAEIYSCKISHDSNPHCRRQRHTSSLTIPQNTMKRSQRLFHASQQNRSVVPDSKIPHISVHIAAASSGKGTKFTPEKSTFDYDNTQSSPALGIQRSDYSIWQKRRARPNSGQDSYFVAAVGKDSDRATIAFGVCDGVGGWSDHGIDPADFSHGLCSYMAETALNWRGDSSNPDEKLTPLQLMDIAYDEVAKDPQIKAGGSTACVGVVEGDGKMRIANLGDSGYLQLRPGAVFAYSNPQTHAFNTPYQMSLTPPEMLAQAMVFGGLPLNDLPERADLSDHTLQHGDVIILASDGVWDNLSSQDVLTTVSNTMREVGAWTRTKDRGFIASNQIAKLVDRESALKQGLSGTLQSVLATSITGEAKAASHNRKRDGPFAKAWKLHAPYDPYHGGKVDDISVLVIIPVQDGYDESGALGTDESGDDRPLKAKL